MRKSVLSWGSFMCDIIAPRLERVAEPGVIEYVPQGIELRPGGHPVDLIMDLARIGVDQRRIGFVSAVGRDVFAEFLLGGLRPYQFKPLVERVDAGTGKTMILSVKGKDRLCHLDPGACQHMSAAHLERTLLTHRPEFFTLRPGYTNLDTTMAGLLKRSRRGPLKDSFILLDLCAPYRKPWSYYLPLLRHVDAVHGNSKEITRVAGEDTFAAAAEKILSLGVKAVFLTREGDGAEVVTRACRISQPAFKIRFVEPSGCGDAFCAGVVYALMRAAKDTGQMDASDLAEVLIWGQALGAAAATAVGCVEGVTKAKVATLLKLQRERVLRATRIETAPVHAGRRRMCAGNARRARS